jgi:PAS domain S-box-containing protein/putative nucleotidyltransferase with HDIG domain
MPGSDAALDVAAETLTTHRCAFGGEPRCIADAIPHIVWTAAPDGATTYFNRRGTDYTGCTREANYGWDWLTLVHPDDAERARQAWTHATTSGSEYDCEYRIRRFDGTFRWHAVRAVPLRDTTGEITIWIGTATDIEDQKQQELSLRRAERESSETVTLLRSIENSAPVGFKLVDRDFRVVRINERLARVDGHSVDEHLGRTVPDLWPDLWPQLEDVYRRALTGEATCNLEVTTPGLEDPEHPQHWLASYYPVSLGDDIIGVGNVVVEITDLKDAVDTIAHNLAAMVDTIARTVECRDPYTAGHQRRVGAIAAAISEEMGLDPSTVEGIRTAATIHDIGKISIPAEILSRPGRLSAPELELIKQHAEAGFNIVDGIDFPWPVAEMIRQHHERMDGSGYPRGLKGEEILLGARIIAVADVVEAMTAHRPYRPGHGIEVALSQIDHDRGTLLDAPVVEACLRAVRSGRAWPPKGAEESVESQFGSVADNQEIP